MGRNVRVTVETFGNRKLERVLDAEQARSTTFDQALRSMMNERPVGYETIVHEALGREMKGGNYLASVAVNEPQLPVRFQPVKLGEPISKYAKQNGPEEWVRFAVTGDHEVGYR